MRRFVLLATSAFVALLVLAPAAVAQDMMEEKMEEKKMDNSMMMKEEMEMKKMDDSMMMKEKMEMKKEEPKMKMDEKMKMEEEEKMKMKGMPKTGGPEIGVLLLPASALLLCSGILGYAILRRR